MGHRIKTDTRITLLRRPEMAHTAEGMWIARLNTTFRSTPALSEFFRRLLTYTINETMSVSDLATNDGFETTCILRILQNHSYIHIQK